MKENLIITDTDILYNLGYAVNSPINPVKYVEAYLIDSGIGIKSYNELEKKDCYEQFSINENELYYCSGRAVIKTNDKVLIRTVKIIMELLKTLERNEDK